MKKPIQATLIFGILSALCVIPFTHLLAGHLGWLVVYKLFGVINLTLYSLLLCRWSGVSLTSILFPLLLVSGVAMWPNTHSVLVLVALCVFSWIRSGICFKNVPARGIIGEIVTMGGGAGLIVFHWPSSTFAQPIALWLFFLLQTLYFFIVPNTIEDSSAPVSPDPFEQSYREVERLLNTAEGRQETH